MPSQALLGLAIYFLQRIIFQKIYSFCKNWFIGLISQKNPFCGNRILLAKKLKCIRIIQIIVSFGALANLYPQTPLSEDIAGTKESISEITVENLKENFKNFYHPSNMTLFVIGNFDLKQIAAEIAEQQEKLVLREL